MELKQALDSYNISRRKVEKELEVFISSVLKKKNYSKRLKISFVQIQNDNDELAVYVCFEWLNSARSIIDWEFYIDSENLENAEESLEKQVEEFLSEECDD